MTFTPDYRMMIDVVHNRRPSRLPLYEHIISPGIMEKILHEPFAALHDGGPTDLKRFFSCYNRFFQEMTYDTVSYEYCITPILPGHGAIMGGRPGPIQNRADFENYPWPRIPELFWQQAQKRFDALASQMPAGMKALGDVGNGVFEIAEDLVGFEYLGYMQIDDPSLFTDLFQKIGDVMVEIWTQFLKKYADIFAICRFGDDLGFKTGPLLKPDTIRKYIIPQYHRVIELIHAHGRPFLWHSCGCIFEIMDDAIAAGIDAKHSNEDAVAPFDRWISSYGQRIGLLGGIDVDLLCQKTPEEVFDRVVELGRRFHATAQGYALGSGNSIPDYVPVDNYLAMVHAVQEIRKREGV